MAKRREVTEESFLKDVREHAMTVIRDDGVHRHIRFRKPSSGVMHFDIVTYPHHLCYSGDMGCYVFSRIDDMFEFFRRPNGPIEINESYWSEKIEATDKPDGHKKFDPDRASEYIKNWLDDKRKEAGEDFDAKEWEELREHVEDELIGCAHDSEGVFYNALYNFEHEGERPFQDSVAEANFDSYTLRFQWCCFALVWAIRQYDAAKEKARA
jgi:hypothetical protein